MLQHQIVQSPARLGLTNPNSPSLQTSTPPRFPSSQQPSQQQQQQQPSQHPIHPNLSAPAASSNLLSYLPPLPRAQVLLLQMASLVSKLFEVSPNRSLWLSTLRGSFPTFLSSQIQSHPPPALESTPTSTKEVIALFTSLQTHLFEAVAQLQEILDLQDSKQKFAREIKSKDASLLSFANKLKEAERILDMLADDYSDYRRPKRLKPDEDGVDDDDSSSSTSTTTVASQLKLSDILSYAHRISYTTFAPPEFGAGQAPLRGALPPAPQEEQMRASQLYNFADLDVGLPKTDEAKEKTIEPFMEPSPPVDADPFSQLKAALKVPPGWKPGMPVDLLDLPLPSSLPPLESLPVRPIPPPVLQRPPETIQVRHVDLEIGDTDDDSSDYSGDESSSD
ncbi:hypothetical protein SLE2022_076590 [Rubroshorea leprosula]